MINQPPSKDQLATPASSSPPREWTLAKPGWILRRPIPLDRVNIRLHDVATIDADLTSTLKHARRALPWAGGVQRIARYSDAMAKLGEMNHLYNGTIYRLLDVNARADSLDLDFTTGRYFDHLDTSLVLSFEAAARDLAGKRVITAGSYRRFLRDPFDLRLRAPSLGINTVTFRRGDNEPGFYMHRRDGRWVAEGPDIIHVVPAGEFTPSDIGLEAVRNDFDIWRTIMRE